jgi:hypothetical protein
VTVSKLEAWSRAYGDVGMAMLTEGRGAAPEECEITTGAWSSEVSDNQQRGRRV